MAKEKKLHKVSHSESAESVAAAHGLPVSTVWDAPENEKLKSLRKDPHILHEGDEVFLPPWDPKVEKLATNQCHVVVVNTPKSKLRLRLLKHGQPRKNQPFELTVDGKLVTKGQIDGSGNLEAEISASATSASVTVGDAHDKITYDLDLHFLSPLTEPVGWQARLANLGYPVPSIEPLPSRSGSASLYAFQTDQKMKDPNGEPDAPTRDKLKEIYGC